ncbi:MAG: 50S ribosomal protein L13 [Chloroflexi bacterium]|jgi:large subunit ribosomal protein L13|nr:50S ribosomal protein L13 [Chloroflexota bacterium]
MTVEKTYVIKGEPENEWLLVDANGQNIGRLATQIASYLLGKHKPSFTPGVKMGDFVVVINADHLAISPKKLMSKMYYRHSGYPSGLRKTTLKDMMQTYPERVIKYAVWGMIPHNRHGRALMKRLKVYAGNSHPHAAQNPRKVN